MSHSIAIKQRDDQCKLISVYKKDQINKIGLFSMERLHGKITWARMACNWTPWKLSTYNMAHRPKIL